MAHRDTDTLKWDDEWFQNLLVSEKLFWIYLCDKSDCAGVWKENKKLAEFQIGCKIDLEKMKTSLKGKAVKINDRWVILKFIHFHYGTLSPTHKMHKKVIETLNHHNLEYSIDTLSIVYLENENTLSESQDRVKDKDKDKDKDIGSINVNEPAQAEMPLVIPTKFEMFWKAYPKKIGKGAAEKAWNKITSPGETLELITSALSWQTKSEQWTKDNGQFIPNPSTYLNQKRWLDERILSDMDRLSAYYAEIEGKERGDIKE
jgi:hypothetical protein